MLRESLSPLPTAPHTIRVTEPTGHLVRWEITMPHGPWGLTYGRKTAVEDNGWKLQTSEWCHMQPQRF